MESWQVVKILNIRFIKAFQSKSLWRLLSLWCFSVGRWVKDWMALLQSLCDLCFLSRKILPLDIYEKITVLPNGYLFLTPFMRWQHKIFSKDMDVDENNLTELGKWNFFHSNWTSLLYLILIITIFASYLFWGNFW